jgi:hypothetical protein
MTAHNPPKGIARKYMREQLWGERKHIKLAKFNRKGNK